MLRTVWWYSSKQYCQKASRNHGSLLHFFVELLAVIFKMKSLVQKLILFVVVLFGVSVAGVAQSFTPASPPTADPQDGRFDEVREDLTTPSLESSKLKAVAPLSTGAVDKGLHTVEIVRVQWRWGDPIDLYVMKPKGVKKPPVVLYLYGYNSDTDRFMNDTFQERATRDGMAAVGFVSELSGARYHDRPMKEWFVSDLAECMSMTAHDVQMILNYLASRGDLDMDRVGMFGQDSGASIAILASAVDPRIKVLDLVDPWGAWPEWLAGSPIVPEQEREDYLTPEFLKKAAGLDPVVWLPKIQAKKIRLQDATFALSTPQAAKDKIRAAVPTRTNLIIYKTPEETKAISQDNKVLAWMERQLEALAKPDPNVKVASEDSQGRAASAN